MKELLFHAFTRAGLTLTDEQADRFLLYYELLTRANRVMNLTGVEDDAGEMIDRNFLDSVAPLAVPGLMDGVTTLADIGSGAGLPAIPLAIMRRDIHIVLFDALSKRVGFLKDVIHTLDLNAEAVHARAEDAARIPVYRDAFDVVCARAVAEMNVLCEWVLPFVRPGGRMIAYKGPSLSQELPRAGNAMTQLCAEHTATYDAPIPGRDWSHKLCVLTKRTNTPDKYPRRPGIPEKRPL